MKEKRVNNKTRRKSERETHTKKMKVFTVGDTCETGSARREEEKKKPLQKGKRKSNTSRTPLVTTTEPWLSKRKRGLGLWLVRIFIGCVALN